jgi:NAD(P)-dependent dehydrogenase (short-subunit alcohol dehydrogenase family)
MRFGTEATVDDVLAATDLAGAVAVVTGATSGLGLETARALAAYGATVVIGGRDVSKCELAREAIAVGAPGAEVDAAVLDLADFASVRGFAERVRAAHGAVRLLVNNAGVMGPDLTRVADGFELQLATNYLGHFLLTALLADRLVAGAPARVVNVSSSGHAMSDVLWDDPNFEVRDYDKWAAYGQSKTAVILHALALDRRLAGRGVRAYAVNPGMAMTGLWRHTTRDDLKLLLSRAPRGSGGRPRTPAQAAATIVWAATAPELAEIGGVYCEDLAVAPSKSAPGDPTGYADWALEPAAAERLWVLTEKLLGQTWDV